jgi:hypothetical protein
MATRKKTESTKQAADGEVVEKAAKTTGSVPVAKAVPTAAPPKKSGKLVKKNKKRLPRKEKKQAKKKLLQ